MGKNFWKVGGVTALAAALVIGFTLRPPKYGKEALQQASSRIESTYVSKAGLLDALTREYSLEAAEYALKKVENTDWNLEALEALDNLSSTHDISYQELHDQLEGEKFEPGEIDQAFTQRKNALDFQAYAITALANYSASQTVNRVSAAAHLKEKQFEDKEIQTALASDTVDWKKCAATEGTAIMSKPVSEALFKEALEKGEYLEEEINDALKSLKPDFNAHCLDYLNLEDQDGTHSQAVLRKKAESQKFTSAQINKAFEGIKTDWRYNAVRLAQSLCETPSSPLTQEKLGSLIKEAGFTDEQKDFVLKYFDESSQKVDDENTIRQKIKAEEEKKKEEEARRKAEEEEAARKKAEEARLAAQQAQQEQLAPQVIDSTGVWIPRTGSKYHSSSSCSNMNGPSQVSLSQAIAWGYTRCKKCW